MREGAGAFVCGEETALIQSLEGKRGMPKLRPPYPVERGFRGRPTIINNVETLACVPWILRHGADAFAALGTANSKGTKVFALAGKINRGGLIEVPMGITIREVVEDIGGGIKNGRPFKAVQLGGPSGGCIPARLADTPIDYEALAQTGAIMGSGGLVVLDDRDCMVDIARFFLQFTQAESCGKCTFCRIGTKRMLEILERLCEGKGRPRRSGRAGNAGRLCRPRQPVRTGPDRAQPGADHAAVLPRRVRSAPSRTALPGRPLPRADPLSRDGQLHRLHACARKPARWAPSPAARTRSTGWTTSCARAATCAGRLARTRPSRCYSMVSLTIDGRRDQRGGRAPPCWMRPNGWASASPRCATCPGIEPASSCFLCAVQIEGRRTFSPACAMPVAEGMVVITNSEDVRTARKMALELLLSDHAGECVAPCAAQCPAGLDIPGFVRGIATGDPAAPWK